MTTPSGFYTAAELSNADYHSGPGVSNSGLKTIGERTPAHYWAGSSMNPKRVATASTRPQLIGTAVHAACLEPDKFDAEYVVGEYGARNEAGYKAWAAKQTRAILLEHEYKNVLRMREALHSHKTAAQLLADAYEFEYSAYANDPETGVLVRMRMDLLTAGGWIVDLKKCQDASPAGARKAIETYRYDHQDAFYTDALGWACGEPPTGFAFIFVEEQPPHAVGVYVLDGADRQRGRESYRQNLNTYARCLERNHWPAYGDEPEIIELSQWARRRIDQQLAQGVYRNE